MTSQQIAWNALRGNGFNDTAFVVASLANISCSETQFWVPVINNSPSMKPVRAIHSNTTTNWTCILSNTTTNSSFTRHNHHNALFRLRNERWIFLIDHGLHSYICLHIRDFKAMYDCSQWEMLSQSSSQRECVFQSNPGSGFMSGTCQSMLRGLDIQILYSDAGARNSSSHRSLESTTTTPTPKSLSGLTPPPPSPPQPPAPRSMFFNSKC